MSTANVGQKPAKNYGIIGGYCFLLFTLVLLTMAAWLILLVYLFIQVALHGFVPVIHQAQWMVMRSLNFLQASQAKFTYTIVAALLQFQQFSNRLLDEYVTVKFHLQDILHLGNLITQIILTRILSFLAALPLFLLLFVVFTVDGLVQRDIRKYQGARESTFIFHRAKQLLGHVFFSTYFIYLCMPWAVSPLPFLLVQAVVLALLLQITVTYFKKYV